MIQQFNVKQIGSSLGELHKVGNRRKTFEQSDSTV